MNRQLLCALLLAAATVRGAAAQFELFLVDGNVERPAPAVYDFGSLYGGESTLARFRIRNTSNAAATLNVLAVAGEGFTLSSLTLPIGLNAQASVEFTVGFRAAETGKYSAALRSEGISVLLTATVLPRLTYRVDTGAPGAGAVPLGATVDFGTVARGGSTQRRFLIDNQTPLLLTVPAISVQGGDFTLIGAAPSGMLLQPQQGAEFTVRFSPLAAGRRDGTLGIGDRTYSLSGAGADPPVPKPLLSVDLRQTASAQQGVLTVRFDAPPQVSGTGTATLDFRPAPAGATDPAIAFAAGGRTATFAVSPGDTQVSLPFQTGTTAGILTFTVQLGTATAQQAVTIPAAPAPVTAVQGTRSLASVEIRVTGFDNTRSLSQLTFTFYGASGNVIAPGAIRLDAAADFARYYATSDVGGAFLLRAVFPVTGDVPAVAAFEVSLTNASGSTAAPRTQF
jgi:hypothetical protein